jgi:hypothetical protein
MVMILAGKEVELLLLLLVLLLQLLLLVVVVLVVVVTFVCVVSFSVLANLVDGAK